MLQQRAALKSEDAVLRRMGSTYNIVQYYGMCTEPSMPMLVFELCANGNLRDHVRKARLMLVLSVLSVLQFRASPDQLSVAAMLGCAIDVSRGMMYLQSAQLCHPALQACVCMRCQPQLNPHQARGDGDRRGQMQAGGRSR